MVPRSLKRRLEKLEQREHARVEKAVDQALTLLTHRELDAVCAFYDRQEDDWAAQPSTDEEAALTRYKTLITRFYAGRSVDDIAPVLPDPPQAKPEWQVKWDEQQARREAAKTHPRYRYGYFHSTAARNHVGGTWGDVCDYEGPDTCLYRDCRLCRGEV